VASVAQALAGSTSAATAGSSPFNMCGHRAPRIPTVRVALIGVGQRGMGALKRLILIDGVEVTAVCDVRPERLALADSVLADSRHRPAMMGGDEGWKRACDAGNVDLVYICTPWPLHAPVACRAMEQGKHAATEIPAAISVEQCWELVETSERTRQHCVMLENVCYDEFELLTLNLARAGFFGEVVHCEGAYIHDIVHSHMFSKDRYAGMWRLRQNQRHGNLYPTHGLGPVSQLLNINRGDRFDRMVSMSTADFQLGRMADALAAEDAFYRPFANKRYRGNMNTSLIGTESGKTIVLQHDVTTPRPYSRIHLVSGTDGFAQKYPEPARLARGDRWLDADAQRELAEKHRPEILRRMGAVARTVEGHGGMDMLMDWRLIDCLRNGLPLDSEVYDAAAWSVIGPLSERSVAAGSQPLEVPDFTRGGWRTNAPVTMSEFGSDPTRILESGAPGARERRA
jgi:predicted dehydrogenase